MHDLVVRGGQLVDGTGARRRRADIAVDDGRVTALGSDVGAGALTIDADGRVVAPGFVDVHTHLDVQGFWDPTLSPSPLHGVTTVLGGNCGFTVAPLADGAGEYLMRMLARVEGMPLESLEQGVPWDWTSTAEYLDRLDGTLALNAGFMVGHSALRRVVMGDAATERAATPDEIDRMASLLRAGLAAGAIGFSSTWSSTHNDAAGRPVPSRHATAAELVALAAVCRDFEGTSLEFLPGVGRWDAATEQVMLDMTVAAERPLNWNIIAGSARSRRHWEEKLDLSDRARELGGKIVGLVIPRIFGARFCFRSGFVLDAIEGWREPMALPPAEKLALLSDPAGRAHLAELAEATTGMGTLTDWGAKVIVETFTDETKRYEGRTVADIAADEGKAPFDALLDVVVADDLRTSFRNASDDDTEEDWVARADLWRDPRAVVGASDAGAHLDMLATFSFSTDLLAFGVREHGLLSTEEAVRLLTSVPADLYGLMDRGRLAEGSVADLVVFDEATVGPEEVSTRFDLPGGAGRLYAGAHGVEHVVVNGVPIVAAGALTGATPGTLLRSGRDTTNPSMV
ncbi:MAG TPA: amidohydrolase family protein [Acidimicrobiales bacterium]|jgi:N-acyl-D-aspartate/D-glutamate deacylase